SSWKTRVRSRGDASSLTWYWPITHLRLCGCQGVTGRFPGCRPGSARGDYQRRLVPAEPHLCLRLDARAARRGVRATSVAAIGNSPLFITTVAIHLGVWQSSAQFIQAITRGKRGEEFQFLKLCHTSKVGQARVANPRASQHQFLKSR